MKNVIITGATSSIGIKLIEKLLKNDYSILAIVRPNSKNLNRIPIDEKISILEIEMNDIESLPNIVENDEYLVFYHLAWDGVRSPYRDDRVLQNSNYENTLKAYNCAFKLNCKVFVGAGSQAEYGICNGKIDERSIPNPNTEYGKAKLKSYEEINLLSLENNLSLKWARIFSTYGVNDYENTLIMSTLNKLLHNDEVMLTECKQMWDYINLSEVADILYLLGSVECENGLYNIASGESRVLSEFVYDMKEITNSKSMLNFGAVEYGQEGIVGFEPSVEKVKRNLNWENKISFKKGIENLIQEIKKGDLK